MIAKKKEYIMKRILWWSLPLAAALTGCVSLQEGEVKVIRSTTFGLIVSYDPITNLPEVKFGWNEVQFMRTLNARAEMDAEHKDISIFTGQGTIRRRIGVGAPAAPLAVKDNVDNKTGE